MGVILTHIIQTSISIIVLYAIYWLFLKRDTFFELNRFYLIAALLFSVLLPFFNFNFETTQTIPNIVILLETIQITSDKVERSFFNNMDVYETLLIVYLTGASLFLIRLIFQFLQLAFFISRSEKTKLNQFHIIYHKKFYQPFSFFNLIFVNQEKLSDSDFAEVLVHEQAHSKQWHTLDLIFLEIFTIFQWFNPVVWLYRSSIKEIHEYLADAKVISSGADKKKYFELLLKQNLGYQINDLTNNFQNSLTKKRMLMMTKSKSKQKAKLKYLLSIPITAVLISFFAINLNQDVFAAESEPTKKVVAEDAKTDDVFQVVEVMPEFVGGQEALRVFLRDNIKYPEDARKNKISGIVRVGFTIKADGSVQDLKIIKGIGSSCDEEAMRVVKLLKYKPGLKNGKAVDVAMLIPINFVLK